MSWLYSQALVEEYSADTSLDGAPCALWNGTHTQRASWLPAKMTDACRLSRSGMTFKPLTDDHGEAVLTSFLEAFPAKILAVQEKEPASTESEAACGDTWRELSVKLDPATSSWKTAQCLWEEVLLESSVTLPRWGMMQNGELWERTMPEHLTSGTGSGLWPTPRAQEPGRTTEGYGRGLAELIEGKEQKQKMWPTPVASMSKGSSTNSLTRKNGKSRENDRLDHAVMSQNGGQLNPMWVEWLMGWPLGWTDCAASATDKFRQWCASHGKF